MDMSKFEGHTPGPWQWIGYDLESAKSTPMEVTVRCGQYCQGGSPHVEIIDADRALIAAAPELLEEITRLRARVEELAETLRGEHASFHNVTGGRRGKCRLCEELGIVPMETDQGVLNDARKGEEE